MFGKEKQKYTGSITVTNKATRINEPGSNPSLACSIHFSINTFGKGLNLSSPCSHGLIQNRIGFLSLGGGG